MTYVCWAALYEGVTDRSYFDVLIPRMMEAIVIQDGVAQSTITSAPAVLLSRGAAAAVAAEACEAREAFHLCFIHADTGGRALEGAIEGRSGSICDEMGRICAWQPERCIIIAPRKETEAWLLADGLAVTSALGYSGSPESIGLPGNAAEAERLRDPKAVLAESIKSIRGRRRSIGVDDLFVAIAQRQELDALRRANSFRDFESKLRRGLASIGCIPFDQ